jgi:CRP-like cAMP-binding protein
MVRLLHEQPARSTRTETNLVDQFFESSEKRLARYGDEDRQTRALPKLSQELLAEMIGTTRSRVNFFMNKFRKLGFIEYNGSLKVNASLMSVVLHD